MKQILVAVAFVLVGLLPGVSQAVTIDFDSLPGMPNNQGAVVPGPSQLSNQLHPTTGAVFSSDVAYVAVVDLGLGHAISSSLPGEIYNGIGGVDVGGNLSYGTPITVTFFNLLDASVKAVTNFVEIRGDQLNTTPGTATLTAFDINGVSLGSVMVNDVAGGLTLSLSVSGIHSVQISETFPTIAFDNLSFNPLTAPVPEPASLMLLGAGLAAIVIWRRKAAKG